MGFRDKKGHVVGFTRFGVTFFWAGEGGGGGGGNNKGHHILGSIPECPIYGNHHVQHTIRVIGSRARDVKHRPHPEL